MITKTWDELTTNEEDLVCFEGAPFTGIAEGYVDGKLHTRNEYLDGLEHGLQRCWYGNGQLSSEETTCLHAPHGYRRVWYPTGQVESEVLWEHGYWITRK